MAARSSRNNTLAGLFVLASILLFVGLVIVLSNVGDRLKPRSDYVVRFSVADGAEGLDKGAPVKVGGQRVGRVTRTEFITDPETGEPRYIDVAIAIDARLKLFTDADVQLQRPLLGSGSSINIAAFTGAPRVAGAFEGPPTLLTPGSTIPGRLGAPGFLAQGDYARIQSILARVDRITAEAEPRIGEIMASAQQSVDNVKAVTEDARVQWPVWSRNVTDVLARVERASAQFDGIATGVTQTVDAVKRGVEEARGVVSRVQAAIDENRPAVDRAIANVRDLTERVNTELYAQVRDAVASARAGIDSAASAARQADELLLKKSPELEEMIANASLASQQLKLTTVEIRSAPWRLLYQPTKKELENELLYNSVRQYSEAVGELRQAAEALRSVSARAAEARAAGREIDQAAIDRLSAKLQDAFGQYQEQERSFLQRWSRDAGR